MNMECKFEIIGDFGDVLEASRKLFKDKASLKIEGVVYSLFNYYINGIDIKPKEDKLYKVIMSAPVETRLRLMNYLTEEMEKALKASEPNTANYGISGLPFDLDLQLIFKIITDDCGELSISCTRFLHQLILHGLDYNEGDAVRVEALSMHPIGQGVYDIFPGILNAFALISAKNLKKSETGGIKETRLPSPQEIIDKLLNEKREEKPGESDDPKKRFLDMINNILGESSGSTPPGSPFGGLSEMEEKVLVMKNLKNMETAAQFQDGL